MVNFIGSSVYWSATPELHLMGDNVPKGKGIVLGGTVKSANKDERVYDRVIEPQTLLNAIMLWDVVAAPRVFLNGFGGLMEIGVKLDDFQLELHKRGMIHPVSFEYRGPIENAVIDQRISKYSTNDFDIFSSSRMFAAQYLAERDKQRWTLGGENGNLLETVKDDNAAVLSLAMKLPLIESVNNANDFEKFINNRKDQRHQVFHTLRRLIVSARSEKDDLSKLSLELKFGIGELERVLAESKGTYRIGALEVSLYPLSSFHKRFIGNYAGIETAEGMIEDFLDDLSLDPSIKIIISAIGALGKVKINHDIQSAHKNYKPHLAIMKLRDAASGL